MASFCIFCFCFWLNQKIYFHLRCKKMEENNKNQSVSNHIRKQCVSCFPVRHFLQVPRHYQRDWLPVACLGPIAIIGSIIRRSTLCTTGHSRSAIEKGRRCERGPVKQVSAGLSIQLCVVLSPLGLVAEGRVGLAHNLKHILSFKLFLGG